MATLRQLSFKNRIQKRRRCKVAALLGAPMRKGVVVKMLLLLRVNRILLSVNMQK